MTAVSGSGVSGSVLGGGDEQEEEQELASILPGLTCGTERMLKEKPETTRA